MADREPDVRVSRHVPPLVARPSGCRHAAPVQTRAMAPDRIRGAETKTCAHEGAINGADRAGQAACHEETPIPGFLRIDLTVHGDNRGWFKENWQREKMLALGLPDFGPVQNNISFNNEVGVTRGIHAEPWDKFVSVATGRVFGAWVDLREGPSFGAVYTARSTRRWRCSSSRAWATPIRRWSPTPPTPTWSTTTGRPTPGTPSSTWPMRR